MDREEKDLPQKKDPHLDIPSEANTDKHINFLEVEESSNESSETDRKETEDRQRQWREGLEEGQRERRGE